MNTITTKLSELDLQRGAILGDFERARVAHNPLRLGGLSVVNADTKLYRDKIL